MVPHKRKFCLYMKPNFKIEVLFFLKSPLGTYNYSSSKLRSFCINQDQSQFFTLAIQNRLAVLPSCYFTMVLSFIFQKTAITGPEGITRQNTNFGVKRSKEEVITRVIKHYIFYNINMTSIYAAIMP